MERYIVTIRGRNCLTDGAKRHFHVNRIVAAENDGAAGVSAVRTVEGELAGRLQNPAHDPPHIDYIDVVPVSQLPEEDVFETIYLWGEEGEPE